MTDVESNKRGMSKAAKKIGKVAGDTWNNPDKLDDISLGLSTAALALQVIPVGGNATGLVLGLLPSAASARSAHINWSNGDKESAIWSAALGGSILGINSNKRQNICIHKNSI